MKKIYKKLTVILLILFAIGNVFILTSCDKHRVMEEDTVFYMDLDKCKVKNIPFLLFADKESSITLRKDGTATLLVKADEGLDDLLNYMISRGNLDNIYIDPVFIGMAEEYFPGFTVYDIEETLGLLKRTLSLSINGLNASDPAIQALFVDIVENGTIPADVTIPNGLEIEYTAEYYIKDVYSKYSGKHTGIFMGKQSKNGEPFVIMDLTLSDKNKQQVTYINEIIDLVIIATKK